MHFEYMYSVPGTVPCFLHKSTVSCMSTAIEDQESLLHKASVFFLKSSLAFHQNKSRYNFLVKQRKLYIKKKRSKEEVITMSF